ncbi:MAG: hypothetical protein ACR2KV_00455 [Solirubrobacteraceae bacterium]
MFLTLASPGCHPGSRRVGGLAVRLGAAGSDRTQRLRLDPPLEVSCATG